MKNKKKKRKKNITFTTFFTTEEQYTKIFTTVELINFYYGKLL